MACWERCVLGQIICFWINRHIADHGECVYVLLFHPHLLRQQMNPHFIFNSINTLADLIEENPVQAESFTLKFSEIYRYVVTHLDDETVPVHEEIHFVKNYCELQEISSPHTIHVEIAEELERCKNKTLPLAIQMMVENAIKHNCHTKESPLSISVYCHGEYIIVRNVVNPIKSTLQHKRDCQTCVCAIVN